MASGRVVVKPRVEMETSPPPVLGKESSMKDRTILKEGAGLATGFLFSFYHPHY
jgi:hypothetical protein